MKKLTSMYKRYMFHPILYKTVTRTSIVAVLMLLWQRYVSDGTFTIWEAPGFLCGVVLLIWAWVDYLRLDGVTIHPADVFAHAQNGGKMPKYAAPN